MFEDGSWEQREIPSLAGGLNISVRADQLEDNQLLEAMNLLLRKEQVESDSGYAAFSDAVRGYPQATFQFYKTTGTSELVCVTTATFYTYSSTHGEWHYVSDGVDTTADGGEPEAETNINVSSITGFSDGDFIGITLDNGMQHKTTINGTPAGTTIVITDGIPAGRTVPNLAAIVKAVDLAGSDDSHVCILTLPSHNWIVFTNNVDPIYRYDGTTVEPLSGVPASGDFICRWMCLYNNALFAVATQESGTRYPQRVRRSEQGDPTVWTGGTAGYTDLYDESDENMACEVLGPYIVVYRERSIARGEFFGSGGLTYDFKTVLRGEGVPGPSVVVDLGDKHVFLGNTNIYAYRGGFDIEPIGDNIFYKIFGSQSIVEPAQRYRSFAVYVEELDEVWFFLPKVGSDWCNYVLKLVVSEETYSDREFADSFRGYGFYQKDSTLTWNDLVGTWAEQTWRWNDRTTVSGTPTTHLCAAEANQVYEYDFVTTLDDDAEISYTLMTKDFLLPGGEFRHDQWEADVEGTDVLVEYSTNGGIDWTELGTVSSGSLARVRLWAQFVADRVRYRVSGTGTGFKMGYMRFDYKLEND